MVDRTLGSLKVLVCLMPLYNSRDRLFLSHFKQKHSSNQATQSHNVTPKY